LTSEVTRQAIDAVVHAPGDQPLFLFVSHHAPHSPSIPDEQYARAVVGPTLNQEDKDRKRCLLSVDDSIASIAAAMGGRWDSAIVLALSDNGYMLGEHDRQGKATWWDQAERVPLLARLPGVSSHTDDRLVSSIDVCPTLLRATGAKATWPMDGLALQDAWDRDSVLIHGLPDTVGKNISFVGLKGKDWVYVKPAGKPARYYADAAEKKNTIGKIDPAPLRARLKKLLA
jgi:membrane-anchored protein YejM (alkaline phosphatase superfamily)